MTKHTFHIHKQYGLKICYHGPHNGDVRVLFFTGLLSLQSFEGVRQQAQAKRCVAMLPTQHVSLIFHILYNTHYCTMMKCLLLALALFSVDTEARLFGNVTFAERTASFHNTSLCAHIRPNELPQECSCSEPSPFSLVIQCLKTFNSTYFNDTIGMKINVDPCNKDGSRVELEITEKQHDIDYPITGIRSGIANMIPIPGLSIAVPTVGHVGLDAAILFTGNPDSLTLKIGLDACIELPTTSLLCASKIPGIHKVLPWYVLSGTYSFGDICANNRTGILQATVAQREEAIALIQHKRDEKIAVA
jgi:hypothetical protein